VIEVLAQPVGNESPRFKVGDNIQLSLGYGYGAPIEDGILEVGGKYLLTIRFNKETNVYEHAYGSGAVRSIEAFPGHDGLTALDRRGITQTRELAALPLPKRMKEELRLISDPKAQDFLRTQAILELRRRLESRRTSETERQETSASLRRVWNDRHAALSYQLMGLLDSALSAGVGWKEWGTSDEHVCVWLDRLFTPEPAGSQQAQEKLVIERSDNLWYLRELLESNPKKVGARSIIEIANLKQPLSFRVALALTLQVAYQRDEQEQDAWKQALQTFYPRALDEAKANDLWQIAQAVQYGINWQDPSLPFFRRSFGANNETKASLERALARLREQAKNRSPHPHPDSGLAIRELESAMVALRAGGHQ